jgi:uncharacterized protein HemY
MRVFLIALTQSLALWLTWPELAQAQVSDASTPTTWEPAYWDKMMLAAKEAQQRGDKIEAESLCSKVIPYVEAQAVKALRDHADLLEAQKSGSAADARARAERLAQVKADQARARAPSSTYLGFVPWEELHVYVGALQLSRRDSDAQAVRLLAAAYRRSQEAYIRRTLLMREGKDPRGEC